MQLVAFLLAPTIIVTASVLPEAREITIVERCSLELSPMVVWHGGSDCPGIVQTALAQGHGTQIPIYGRTEAVCAEKATCWATCEQLGAALPGLPRHLDSTLEDGLCQCRAEDRTVIRVGCYRIEDDGTRR